VPRSASNESILKRFLDYLKIEKGLARLTVAAYTTDIGQFAEFLERRNRHLAAAQREDVGEFLQQLFSNQVDGRSVGRKLSALRHLYRYLLLDGDIRRDPTLNIDSPRQWKVLPKSLAKSEVEATLVNSRRVGNRKLDAAIALRDKAMLELLYACGLRVSEIVNAKLEDLKLDMGYVLVRGKGEKERVTPIGAPALKRLEEYLREARPVIAAAKHSPLLFIRNGSRPLTRQRVWQMVQAAANDFGSCRYLDYAGVYAPCVGSLENRLPEAPSPGEGSVASRARIGRRYEGRQRWQRKTLAEPSWRKRWTSFCGSCTRGMRRRTPSRATPRIFKHSRRTSARATGSGSIIFVFAVFSRIYMSSG
jgi:integrase/recombinase XerD